MAATEDAPPSLSRLFLQGWEARRKILRKARYGREYTGCMQVSLLTRFSAYDYVSILSMDLQKCLEALERTTELANEMSLFSDNKDLVELATASHK